MTYVRVSVVCTCGARSSSWRDHRTTCPFALVAARREARTYLWRGLGWLAFGLTGIVLGFALVALGLR